MKNNTKRLIWVGLGLVLWLFYFLQEELAFYGIYTLIDYSVHEVASMIPFISFFVIFIWLIVLIKNMLQKKSTKDDWWFALLLVILLSLQSIYFTKQSQEVHTIMVVNIESIDHEQGTITMKNAYGDEEFFITCSAPEFMIHLVEVGSQDYLATYIHDKETPEYGKLSTLKLSNR